MSACNNTCKTNQDIYKFGFSKKAEHQYFQAVLFSSVERKTTKNCFLISYIPVV